MKHFFSVQDIDNIDNWVQEARLLKEDSLAYANLGKGKVLGLLFFNPSLRTRLSTQKAALNLGMHSIIMNFDKEGWAIEYEDGSIMHSGKSEHIKEAAQVISQYCDILAIRAFAKLENRRDDYEETVLNGFMKYASIPVINMESATGHPLQALTDAITLNEHKPIHKPKVVLTWAPHPKALPQAVANSFVEMMQKMDVDFCITQPQGFELSMDITKDTVVMHNQKEAFANADFIYAKNWSSFYDYGKTAPLQTDWQVTKQDMELTNNAKFMHCLPVRRNVVVSDDVIESPNAMVIQQAHNRTYAAQLVLKKILENKL